MEVLLFPRCVAQTEQRANMIDSTDNARVPPPAATDSPWFWVMVFSAAGLLVLVIAWPKYIQRQARIELQYRASQEVTRRRVEGEPSARPRGQEGDARPPAAGELLVPLWPIGVALALVLCIAAIMFVRGRRRAIETRRATHRGATP